MDGSRSIPQKVLTFHCFPDLPAELRLMIWRYCLPHRIVELDDPQDHTPGPFPCGLNLTTYLNGRPPLIARVCRESRDVALRSRSIISEEGMPEEARWDSWTHLTVPPIDPSRDMVHINWEPGSAEYFDEGSSAYHLIWYATQVARGGSLMMRNLRFLEWNEFDALSQLPSWMVVTRVIIIHARLEYAAKTGLFGLLGDELVQIVDVSDEAKVKAFFDFANESQRKGHAHHPQDLHRDSAEIVKQSLKDHIKSHRQLRDQIPDFRAAIMFRLCPDLCNHSRAAEEEFRPSPEPTPPPRSPTRRLPRGRGGIHSRIRGRVH